MVLNKKLLAYLTIFSLLLISANCSADNQQKIYAETITAPEKLPLLLIKNAAGKIIETITFGEEEKEIFMYQSDLQFKVYYPQSLPSPLIVAVAAAPGGSNTLFITKIITVNNDQVKILNGDGWETLNNGGISLDKAPEIIVWNSQLQAGESRPDPHHYKIQFYQWDGNNFLETKTYITKNKYTDYEKALKELNLNIHDLIKSDFKKFDQYR